MGRRGDWGTGTERESIENRVAYRIPKSEMPTSFYCQQVFSVVVVKAARKKTTEVKVLRGKAHYLEKCMDYKKREQTLYTRAVRYAYFC